MTRPLGAPIPFQPPMTHDIVPGNKRKKGAFEKLFLEGRPPVALGVTSGGDIFGGTQVTFTDVLGDKQFNIFAASVSQYRTFSFSYINLSRRLQYAIQAYSQQQFYYAYSPYGAYYPIDYGYIDRDQAIATQTARGATISGIYPLNRYTRLEMSAGFLQFGQEYNEPGLQDIADDYQQDIYGRVLFVDGQFMPFGLSLVRETTIFREYGPLAGHTLPARLRVRPERGEPAVADRPSRATRATTCASPPTASWRFAPAATRAGASTRAISTSAATPRCAATTICRSSATRGSSPTPSFASRSSKRR